MREVKLERSPSRIVSLVPSLTELLYDLGLENRIAGITKFCIHPESLFRSKIHVGGTKKIDHHTISKINPDLIIANKEENLQSDIEALSEKFPVWISDIYTLEDSIDMIEKIGVITDTETSAQIINHSIRNKFSTITNGLRINTIYLIWKEPFMAAGSDTFINDMMKRCGMINVLPAGSRYPEISREQLIELNPELVLLSSEPYPFKAKHIEEIKSILPDAKCLIADGESFSWYGSHLIKSPDYFNKLILQLQDPVKNYN